jgi:hypothetical protein
VRKCRNTFWWEADVVAQNLDDILAGLQPLIVDWQDDISRRVIAEIEAMPVKKAYTLNDVMILLDKDFDDALLICRRFLGLSKDTFTGALHDALSGGAAGVTIYGVTIYKADKLKSLEALLRLGILEAMAEQTNRVPRWSDILVERLRSGCGSAISGQIRGRGVEDFAEAIVRRFSMISSWQGAPLPVPEPRERNVTLPSRPRRTHGSSLLVRERLF